MKQFINIAILILFSTMTQAQDTNDSFDSLWKQVQQLEDKALTKSALKMVQTISEKAKKTNNSAQVVKSLIYTSKYALTLEEDAQLKIVNAFKTEIEKAPFPTKNVLESYMANLYWQYFQQNRYKFYNRTKTETKVDATDFRTWDLTTIFQEITLHFERSLKNEDGLRNSPIDDFEPILNKQKGSSEFRPSLLDLLGHAALDFYKTGENNITRPADKFEINDPELLCEAVPFLNKEITTTDATSLQAKALHLYQILLNNHVPDANYNAFVEIDIERLKYIYQNATFQNKDQHYLEVLNNTASAKKGTEAEGLYRYEIASLYQQQGAGYSPTTNTEVRWKLKDALQICEEVMAAYPKAKAGEKCMALKSQILDNNLYLTTERHLPLNKQARLLVNYKNYHSLELSAYSITLKQLEQLEKLYKKPQKQAFIEKLPLVTKWQAVLKNEGDHQTHTTEVSVPPLGNGHYLLMAKPSETNQKDTRGTFAYSPVQVTDLTVLETKTNTHHQFQIVDRNNGSPILGATVKIRYQVNYDRGFLEKTMSTDKNGMVRIPLSKQYWNNVTLRIRRNKETAHFGEFYVNQKYDQSKSYRDQVAFLFTDRSIYRPGQPLYFKGIAVARSEASSSVLTNASVNVILKDVNYQEVGRQEFKTNEYGSFSGEFILPSNGLTGNFTLEVQGSDHLRGSTSFSVEEYKRPKFSTFFKPVMETYKVNDSVTVTGNAMAYAGSAITEAKVSYTVRRVVYYPRWYSWYRPYFNSSPQEIAHGQTITDDNGDYTIPFKALPDASAERKSLPIFNYEITADVTDINGETHSATTTVRVGYHSLTASMYVSNLINKEEDAKLTVSTSNLNGQFVAAKGNLKMYKLKAPEYVLRKRPWPAPDYEGFTKQEFKKQYPHDAYGNEHDTSQWEKGALVWESQFDTGKSAEIPFGTLKKWRSGKYIIELEAKDKFGQLVQDRTQTTLYSPKDKTLSDNQLFFAKTDKTSYKIGEKAKVTLSSSAEDVTVTVFIEKKNELVETRLIELNNNSKSFSIPITKTEEGGFSVSYSFTVYNSYQVGSLPINVPYPQNDLTIETRTFRDKLRPGTDESWSFKIKGAKGEKVTAELLASMYDASLDSFRGHYWSFDPIYRPYYYTNLYIQGQYGFGTNSFDVQYGDRNLYSYPTQYFDSFNWFGFYFGHGSQYRGRTKKLARMSSPQTVMAAGANEMNLEESAEDAVAGFALGAAIDKDQASGLENKADQRAENQPTEKEKDATDLDAVKIRKNLQENAFFFPQLQTDAEGNVSFRFTTPEALTKWNLQLLAHTKTLESGYSTLQTVTQKELMVIPNAPRFLREGDEIVVSAKIANLTGKKLNGQAQLELIDAVSGKEVSARLKMVENDPQDFLVDSLGNTQVSWRLKIPEALQAVQYKVIAKAGDHSDGEQNLLPVLTNRMLVTETLPMWVRSNQRKTFVLDKLKTTTSTSLKHHKLSLEITSNPAWYAVQALPYLMEYPHECSEQLFSRYYANSLASHIANGNPRIQEVFDQWRNSDALLSNLEKNQELKSLLIQETPWLRDAQSETEQKKRIALLFNLDKMKNEQVNALRKLQRNQKSDGAWSWFSGGPSNRFITQHIASGMGHLKKLSVTTGLDKEQAQMLKKAVAYLDQEFLKEYDLMKRHASNINDDHLSSTQIHYLYMRSFFKELKTSSRVDTVTAYYKGQAQKYWMNKKLYSQGMLGLILHRMGDTKTANLIIRSLEENSINSEELGMYWKENTASWYWYQAPIETQALLIEAFSEIQNKIETIDNLKIWLLKNKQTNQWQTTKATTEAVYALLLQGSDWLSVSEAVAVLVGGEKITPSTLENVQVEAGTGYYKTAWNGNEIQPAMAEVQLDKKGEGIAWGALYWQYFEDLDKISSAETPLQLKKKLFLKKNTPTGEQIKEITDKTTVKVGDLIRVRIELRSDRAMEFVHMKDMRAAGFEPINVISKYKWQDGLGYYESTKDASTNFFFDYLPKGVYIFEYDVRANNAGTFSNGITTIQSMYAPEFSSHSEGVRVAVFEL